MHITCFIQLFLLIPPHSIYRFPFLLHAVMFSNSLGLGAADLCDSLSFQTSCHVSLEQSISSSAQ